MLPRNAHVTSYRPTASPFVTHPPSTDIYTLSLHDALPIFDSPSVSATPHRSTDWIEFLQQTEEIRSSRSRDRKSTRLNSSHSSISYAVFCLKKKRTTGLRERTA